MPKLIQSTRVAASALLLALALQLSALAQTAAAPATVSGRVTDGERGAQGVTVMLIHNEQPQRFRVAARAKTDAEGRFLLTGVAPSRYQILPVAPAHIVEGMGSNFPPGRPLNITAGEEVKDIDFRIEPGGVITGRVTDADGNPVVGEQVVAALAEEAPGGFPRPNFNNARDQLTDDRGVYRLFGLPPGRYRVAVGRAGEAGAVSYGRRKLFRRTFHPDAVEEAQARVVEVKAGDEANDVDITVGRALKTYKVSGLFVTSDTNQPVANIPVGYTTVDARGRRAGGFGSSTVTNERGQFVTDGLAPGRYAVFAASMFTPQQQPTEFYSDPLIFEVADSDVSGLVVKLKRGATVSGAVTIEGVHDRAALAQMLSAVRVYAYVEPARQREAAVPVGARPVSVNPDGTFRVTGLSPGKLRLGTMNDAVKGLSTARIEAGGANIMNGLDLAEGAQVSGVNILMTYATGAIAGQVSYVNGVPPPNARVMATARPVGAEPGATPVRWAQVDARGAFRIEGVPAGEYDVIVNVAVMGSGGGRPSRSQPQRVTIGEGGEAKVAPVIDFQPAQPPPRRTEP
jgi:protocatechuate 3,4-dioxygenase beta subunit